MSSAEIKEVYMFPLKGARGTRSGALHIDPVVGVLGDRRIAIKRRASQPDAWAPKIHFRVCMNTPQMAAQAPVFSKKPCNGSGEIELDPSWLQEVAALLGETELDLVNTKGVYNLVDTNPHEHGPTVSFLNLATVRALEAETGWEIDPERFRMNVWFDNGQPFSELAWADSYPGTREFEIGELRFRVQDACERCLAVEANPSTGERDLPILQAIEAVLKRRGYVGSPHRGSFHVMGFLATPLTEEVITRGQVLRMM